MKCVINNSEIPVRYTTVNPPPYNKIQKHNFCTYTICGDNNSVTIEYDFEPKTVVIRPLSANIKADINKNKVSFTIDKPCNISVEPDGVIENSLSIFATAKKSYDYSGYDNIIKFDAGVYDVGEIFVDKDNTLIYIDENAVVNGKIKVSGVKNFKLCGTGVITMEKYTRVIVNDKQSRCLSIDDSCDISVSDVCIFDSVSWSFRLFGCDNVEVNNVKIIGYRGNSDGIDVCGSRNVHISECFIRTFDDCFVVKGFETGNIENLLFEKSVLWNDMARPIEIGVEIRCDELKNVIFKDIDVIHSLTCYPIFGIHHGDRANLSDIHFENIRIENAPGAQLFDFRITDSVWNVDETKGGINGIYIDDIFVVGEEGKDFRNLSARIDGFSEDAAIKNVYIGNIEAYGKKINNRMLLGLEERGFVENVVFKGEDDALGYVQSEIAITEAFELKDDGFYYGKIKLIVENKTDHSVELECGINIYPKNKAEYSGDAISASLECGEKTEKEYEIKTTAGKLVIQSFGNIIEFKPSFEYVELDYVLKESISEAAPVFFNDCYGNELGGVKLAASDGWIEVSSDILKTNNIKLYVTKLSEQKDDNQIMFSVEESYWGEAPNIKWKDNKYMYAPEIGNHFEITYVFLNQPKVEKITEVEVTSNLNGVLKLPYEALGLAEDTKEFWLEAQVEDVQKRHMPDTLFRSTLPNATAHMFCRFIKQD